MVSDDKHFFIETFLSDFAFYFHIDSFEKDPTDNAGKQRESQDCSQKVRKKLSIQTKYYVM